MYLETTHALGGYRDPTSCPVGQKLVPWYATNAQGQRVDSGMTCFRDPDYVAPTPAPLPPSTNLLSYDLTGISTGWNYAKCKTGYIRKLSGKPHPNYYTCFKT
jgi:hypothetical protein